MRFLHVTRAFYQCRVKVKIEMANSDPVQSLARGLQILELVAHSGDGLTLHELSASLEIKAPTVFNLARTLVMMGFLEKAARPVRYRFGRVAMELGVVWERRAITEKFAKMVITLSDRYPDSTVVISEPIGGEVVQTHRVERGKNQQFRRSVTDYAAPYAHVSSLCIYAFWGEREQEAYDRRYPFSEYGVRIWEDESALEKYLESVRRENLAVLDSGGQYRAAVPIQSPRGELIATLGIAFAPDFEITFSGRKRVLRKLRGAVQSLYENENSS